MDDSTPPAKLQYRDLASLPQKGKKKELKAPTLKIHDKWIKWLHKDDQQCEYDPYFFYLPGRNFRVLFCFLHSVSTVVQKTGWSNWALKLHLKKSRLNCGTGISHRKTPWDTNKVKERRKPLAETWPSWPKRL